MTTSRQSRGSKPAVAPAQQAPHRLPGMRDVSEAAYARLLRTQAGMQGTLALHGYSVVETPMLEPTELFLRKSGGELASRMYTFTEPGGRRVSLRPEYTSAVIRLFLEEGRHGTLPARYQYAGPVFRYEPEEPARQRQFTQVGAELLGASGPQADAEVLAVACQVLARQGLTGLDLSIGDVGAVHGLLRQFGLSERARLFLLASVGELRGGGEESVERVRQRAQGLGLYLQTGSRPGGGAAENGQEAPEGIGLPSHLLTPALQNPVGVRTTEEILARLARKMRSGDTPELLDRALGFTAELAQVHGAPKRSLSKATQLARRYGLDPGPLLPLEETLRVLELHGLTETKVSVDLGLARGLAYYTGLVFEVRHGSGKERPSLGGGGRYDGLIRALGGQREVPALGFAYTVERVVEALGPAEGEDRPLRRVLVVPRNMEAYGPALQAAEALRLGGEVAEVAPGDMTPSKCEVYARARGMEAMVTVEGDGSSHRQRI